jgi:hypothetical protein
MEGALKTFAVTRPNKQNNNNEILCGGKPYFLIFKLSKSLLVLYLILKA